MEVSSILSDCGGGRGGIREALMKSGGSEVAFDIPEACSLLPEEYTRYVSKCVSKAPFTVAATFRDTLSRRYATLSGNMRLIHFKKTRAAAATRHKC